MTSKIYLFAAAALMLAMTYGFGVLTGKAYCERAHDRAQTELLKADARKSIELEADHVSRTTQTRQIVQVIRADNSDCANSRSSDAFLTGMRAKGVPARSTPAP